MEKSAKSEMDVLVAFLFSILLLGVLFHVGIE